MTFTKSELELIEEIKANVSSWALEEFMDNPDSDVSLQQRYDENMEGFIEGLLESVNQEDNNMDKLIKNHIIFAIDNDDDLHTVAKFTRFIDTQRALGALRYAPVVCKGSYDGAYEQSYMMDYNDFYSFVFHSGYVDNQESFLHLSPRSPRSVALMGYLVFPSGKVSEPLGQWVEKPLSERFEHDNYTIMDNKLFICQ